MKKKLLTLGSIGIALAMPITVNAADDAMTHAKKKTMADGDVMDTKTIVDVAMGDENFSTLVAAVKAAGLVDVLSGDGPFTVFAPTNEAFAKLPEGTVNSLLLPENKQKLTDILTYHVVPGKVMAADVKSMGVATVQGANADIMVKDDMVKVGDATVTATDIEADNGVIHVIDTVLMPPVAE